MREGARFGQILVSSHSPELLDNPDIPPSAILAVASHEGITRIGRLDDASRDALRDQLFTAGELLRQDQLAPAADTLDDGDERQLKLFEGLAA